MLMTRIQPGKTSIGYMKVQGNTKQNFMRGGFVPWSNPFNTLLYAVFDRKSTPFLYLILTNGTSFTLV